MKNKQALLILFLFLNVISFAQQKNYLHYTSTTVDSSKGKVKKEQSGTVEILIGPQLVIKKTYSNHIVNANVPVKIINTKENYVVMEYPNQHYYYVEDPHYLFSFDTLVPTGIKEKINGYNCEKYKAEIFVSFYSSVASSSMTFTYKLWITNDIEVDEQYNKYLVAPLTAGKTTFPFKGVIVKTELGFIVDKKESTTTTLLDKVTQNLEAEKEYEWPWKKQGITAMLPEEGNEHGPMNEHWSNEKYKDHCERMRQLLKKVTGKDNTPYKRRPLTTFQ